MFDRRKDGKSGLELSSFAGVDPPAAPVEEIEPLTQLVNDGPIAPKHLIGVPVPPGIFSPSLHASFFTFNFTRLAESSLGSDKSLPDKAQLDYQLTNIALVSALLLTLQATFIFEIDNVQLAGDDGQWYNFAFTLVASISLALLMMSIAHAVFVLIMNVISTRFTSMDELACFMDVVGGLETLPARLFIGGLWGMVVTVCLYILPKFELWRSATIILVVAILYLTLHYALAKIMQGYYIAVYRVSNGWRINTRRTRPKTS